MRENGSTRFAGVRVRSSNGLSAFADMPRAFRLYELPLKRAKLFSKRAICRFARFSSILIKPVLLCQQRRL
jgi:hypothetical protein